MTVTVNAGIWGRLRAKVTGRNASKGLIRLVITKGPHKGHEGWWAEEDVLSSRK